MPNQSERGTNLEQGESFSLRASAVTAAVVAATGTAVAMYGERLLYILVLDVTVCDLDAADTLDVYVDVYEPTLAAWINAVHFSQRIGTDAAVREIAVLNPGGSDTTTLNVTADAAVGVVRPHIFGTQMRARWTMVDADADGNFTWSLTGYAL